MFTERQNTAAMFGLVCMAIFSQTIELHAQPMPAIGGSQAACIPFHLGMGCCPDNYRFLDCPFNCLPSQGGDFGVCTPKGNKGDQCWDGNDCLSGDCSIAGCTDPTDSSQRCDPTIPNQMRPCGPGRFCNAGGLCEPEHQPGEDCERHDNSDCLPGSKCYFFRDGNKGMCTFPLRNGDLCDDTIYCPDGLVCRHPAPGFHETCLPPLKDGAPCSHNGECASYNCKVREDGGPPQCAPGRKNGEKCFESSDCASGFCKAPGANQPGPPTCENQQIIAGIPNNGFSELVSAGRETSF